MFWLQLKMQKGISRQWSENSYSFIAVVFPKLFTWIGIDFFFSQGFAFFYKVLEDVIEQRKKLAQKFNDFIQIGTETISAVKKEVDGKVVPVWNEEEVDELVIAQVI